MDVSHILDPLNDAQRQAVTAPLAPTLVLAGAGSGKTRVLTHRVEWLVQVEGVSPHGILAVTFTNKAAGEMRHRIETQLGLPSAPLWIGTFHGICHRLLRMHWREAGLPQGFQILDGEDQQRLVKKIIRGLNLDAQTDEGLRPKHLKDEGDPTRRQLIKLYEAYEETSRRNGVVDFAELLLRSCELWSEVPGLADHYRARFAHVLVDEFQDTNTIQYRWMKSLVGATSVPYVVGDDDQSIYRWRGARVENLRQYQRDFHGVQLFRLEQNYRSTGNILAAANAIIANNSGRIGKKLWTSDGKGEAIRLQCTLCHALPEVVREDGARTVASTVSPDLEPPPSHGEPNFMHNHRMKMDSTCTMCHGPIKFGADGGAFCSNPACHGRKWPNMNLDPEPPKKSALATPLPGQLAGADAALLR